MPPSILSVPNDLQLASNTVDMLTLKGTSTPPAVSAYAPSSPPDDATLSNNTVTPSIDESTDRLNLRVRYSDGTLETGVVPFVKSTLTVGATGADFTTIQAAWDYLKGRYLSSLVTIQVADGTYNEALQIRDQPYGSLIRIEGDMRTAAGVHQATTGSITKTGSDCTITLVNTPPSDFTNADYLIVAGTTSAANVGRFPIVSVDVPNKKVTYTNAAGVAEAVRDNTRVIFSPNRIIDYSGNAVGVDIGRAGDTSMLGFLVRTTSGVQSSGLRCSAQGGFMASRCVSWGATESGFFSTDGALLVADGCSAIKCLYGFAAGDNGTVSGNSAYTSDNQTGGFVTNNAGLARAYGAISANQTYGFWCLRGSNIVADGGQATNCQFGFYAYGHGTLSASGAAARNNSSYGYYAAFAAYIQADSTNANNSGNGTNYSPTPTGTQANNFGLINFS